MKVETLRVATRQDTGKGAAYRLRQTGQVPAVLYGGNAAPVSLRLDRREFEQLLHRHTSEHALVQLEVADGPELSCPALVKAVAHHPVRGDIVHADFQRIRLDQRITTMVPIVLTGHAVGVTQEGGIMDHQLRELQVECLALEVPDQIEMDVTELHIGDSLHVADLVAPANLAIVTDPERTVVAVHAPRVVRAAAEEEEAAQLEAAATGEEEAQETGGGESKSRED